MPMINECYEKEFLRVAKLTRGRQRKGRKGTAVKVEEKFGKGDTWGTRSAGIYDPLLAVPNSL